MDMSCLALAFVIGALSSNVIVAFPIYPALAVPSNLLLFKSLDHGDGSRGYAPLRKGLYAFATSIVSGIPYMLVLAAIVAPWVAPFIIPGLL
jgi:hypothetical protein